MAAAGASPDAGESAAARVVREARAHVATEQTDAQVVDYNAGLVRDLEALRALHLGRHDPEAREVRAAEREVSARQRQIRERVRAAAERVALSVVCGDEAPTLSAWDGELVGSARYLRQTANDPDSIDVTNCTTPVLTRRLLGVDLQRARAQRVRRERLEPGDVLRGARTHSGRRVRAVMRAGTGVA